MHLHRMVKFYPLVPKRNFDIIMTGNIKTTGNNFNLELDSLNADIKLGQIMSICNKDIKRKPNSGINQRP